jgi:Zn-dependent protease/predicted transcriptional regulator
MTGSFYPVRIMGIPIGVHYSWFVVFVLIIVTLSQYVFPELYNDWSAPAYWIVGFFTSLLFFASLIFHELAHSFVAIRKGIEVKSITLFIFGGAAKIAREAASPGAELMMSVAGPISSLFLACFFAVIWIAGEYISEPMAAVGFYLCWINIVLAGFNMLPGFPMDGGRVLRSIIWWRTGDYRKATRVATIVGQAFGGLLILGGAVTGVFVYWLSGIWTAFLGGFIFVIALANQKQTMLREGLRGLTAGDLMISDCYAVHPELSLEVLVEEYLPPTKHRCVLVGERESPLGIITVQDVKQVPKRRRSSTPVSKAMTPVEKIGVVYPDDDALTVLERMGEGEAELLLVMAGDRAVGLIEQGRLRELSRERWKSRQ